MVMLLYWRKCLLLVGDVGERRFHGHVTAKNSQHVTMKHYIILIKSKRCYWMTASLYRKYNTFSDRESEQQHRIMTFAELPNPLLTNYSPSTNYGEK